jgi:hypothetical protein
VYAEEIKTPARSLQEYQTSSRTHPLAVRPTQLKRLVAPAASTAAAAITCVLRCVLQVSCLPNFQRDLANRVFVDVMNEPDSMQIRWEGSSARPGAHQLYLNTADTLWQMTPDAVMFMFEGEWMAVCAWLVVSASACARF